jgi:hypothetical protein
VVAIQLYDTSLNEVLPWVSGGWRTNPSDLFVLPATFPASFALLPTCFASYNQLGHYMAFLMTQFVVAEMYYVDNHIYNLLQKIDKKQEKKLIVQTVKFAKI